MIAIEPSTSLLTRTSEKRRPGLDAEEVFPHRLEMRAAALYLLRDRIDIAQAALEGIIGEDRGGASGVVSVAGDLPRFANAMRGGKADCHTVLDRKFALLGRTPGRFHRGEKVKARRPEPCLELCHVGLNNGAMRIVVL